MVAGEFNPSCKRRDYSLALLYLPPPQPQSEGSTMVTACAFAVHEGIEGPTAAFYRSTCNILFHDVQVNPKTPLKRRFLLLAFIYAHA